MPHHVTDDSICILGSGLMAQAYAKVLKAQGRDFFVLGRGEASAAKFRADTGIDVVTGGLEAWIDNRGLAPRTAIVAVNLPELANVSVSLLKSGTTNLLIEKPGALDRQELRRIELAQATTNASVWIGYNRRFYASTLAAEEVLREDGGPTSMHFEFTEWIHRLGVGTRNPRELAAWFIANSSHVVDLAFHLGGRPVTLQALTGGELHWHPAGSLFVGTGQTDSGALFTYHANWQAPGRWGVELMTRKHRLHMKPLESLGLQEIGSLEIKAVPIDDALDREFKPGIYRQVESFLTGAKDGRLPNLVEHAKFWDDVLDVMATGEENRLAKAA